MPSTATTPASQFGDDYSSLGEYVQDNTLIPYFNPSDSNVDLLPGEPCIVQWGPANGERVFLCNTICRPGQVTMLKKDFTADFPCNFSANIIHGAEVMWDIDNNVVSLAADVTNGFIIGNASFALDPTIKNATPAIDGNGRVVAATATSTVVRVVSQDAVPTIKGTVVNL